MFDLYQAVGLFFLYAFLGWCVEVAFVAVTCGRVVNRGFLNGPVCPIYGFGMLGVLYLLQPVEENLFLLFFGGNGAGKRPGTGRGLGAEPAVPHPVVGLQQRAL